jgi:hypothetical protein
MVRWFLFEDTVFGRGRGAEREAAVVVIHIWVLFDADGAVLVPCRIEEKLVCRSNKFVVCNTW